MRIVLAIPLWFGIALNGQPPAYTINTVAGNGWIGDGGPATLAILRQPGGIAADVLGNVYIAETGGHRVRRVDRAGVITTFAGTGVAGFSGDGGPAAQAQIASPYGLAADIFGNVYIADLGNARVRRVTPDGNIATIAGGGTLPPGPANEGKPATSLQLAAPRNLIAIDGGGLYISDFGGHRVFQLSTDGSLTTIAGTGAPGYSGDGGVATAAQLAYPAGLAIGFDGSLYVADSMNHAVRKISSGVISTFASVGTPVGMALDLFATVYVADVGAGALLRFPVYGTLPPLDIPASDVVRAADFSMYVPESAAGIVQRLPLIGYMALAAGGGDPARGDGGTATDALLNHPSGVAVDASGNLYIADRDNGRVRRVGSDGTIATVAPGAGWSAPSGISVDAAGNVYVVDTGLKEVLRISPAGVVQRMAPGLALTSPATAVADAAGSLYIADTGAGKIFSVTAAGATSTLLDKLAGPHGLALDGAGHLFFTEQDGGRAAFLDLASGTVTDFGAGQWSIPRGIAVSPGEVFVADTGRQQIMRVDSAGQVTVVAGMAVTGATGIGFGAPGFSGDGGAATSAQLNFPWDVALGPAGVYVADLENNLVRSLTPQTTTPPVTAIQVLNGVSLAPGPMAPGMLLEVRGTGIPAVDAANTILLINSIPAPILAMDDKQIQVQVPFTLAMPSDAEIVIIDKGSIAATVTVPTAASAPALYPVDPQAATVPAGATVSLYGTGLGLGDLRVAAAIGGMPAEVVSLNPSPGYTGLFQITLRVPSAAVPGPAGVVVTVGGAASQAGVSITVD
jgi:uncharacterized protein (TIGR03437 family)